MPVAPFEIGALPFHIWPPGCYIHPILYFKNVDPFWCLAPPGFRPTLLLKPGDGPVGGPESLLGAPKNPNNVTNTFFNTVHLLPKDLRFEHGGAKLTSCPGRHVTSLRPCVGNVETNFVNTDLCTSESSQSQ